MLIRQVIACKWGFPFRLLVNYKGRTVVLMTEQQVEEFLSGLDKDEVKVKMLNQEANGPGSGRRNSVICRVVEESQNQSDW